MDRCGPVLPMMPGLAERRTHDCQWQSITSLFAAFDICDNTALSELRRHRAVEFTRFLTAWAEAVSADLDVHPVCGNRADHGVLLWAGAGPVRRLAPAALASLLSPRCSRGRLVDRGVGHGTAIAGLSR